MTRRSLVLMFLIGGLQFCASLLVAAQDKPDEKPADKQATYDSLLEQVTKGDPQADFWKLRMAYVETPHYNPYGESIKSQNAVAKALQERDYEKAAELGENALKTNFVDLKIHYLLQRAYTELKQDDKAKFHSAMFDGLIDSILKSGNGQSPATAMVVITTDEEYAVLFKLGLKRTTQGLMERGGRRYDMLEGVDEQGMTRRQLYFDVTIPFDWLGTQMRRNVEKRAPAKPGEPESKSPGP